MRISVPPNDSMADIDWRSVPELLPHKSGERERGTKDTVYHDI